MLSMANPNRLIVSSSFDHLDHQRDIRERRSTLVGVQINGSNGRSPSVRDRSARTDGLRPFEPLHTTKVLRLSQDLPLVIEIVENEDTINRFVLAIESMMGSALITTEKVKVIRYGNGKPEAC